MELEAKKVNTTECQIFVRNPSWTGRSTLQIFLFLLTGCTLYIVLYSVILTFCDFVNQCDFSALICGIFKKPVVLQDPSQKHPIPPMQF